MDTEINTEALTVLIVAKTRRKGGACIGAVTADGRSLRLEAANAATDEHAGLEYQVGEVWQIDAAPHPHIVPPHVETVVVYGKRRLRNAADPIGAIEKCMPPVCGGIDVLYEGLVQSTPGGALYITRSTGVPSRSTLFWRPDRPLRLADNGVRLHYCYDGGDGDGGDGGGGDGGGGDGGGGDDNGDFDNGHDETGHDGEGGHECGRRFAFVGFQEPLAEIPAGALVRISLAHWWHPRDHPDEEERCYLQLSGWFVTQGEQPASAGAPVAADGEGGHLARREVNRRDEQLMPGAQVVPFKEAGPQTRQVLKDVFGYDSFRPLQEEIIDALLHGRDTLAVMPTGAGKSLCYQLPALLWPRLTVVVSPLISLMQDQVDALLGLNVAAAYLNSTLTFAEQRRLMDRVRGGEIKLLYAAPETLVRPEVLYLLEQTGVDCLAVDEAHCISAWGHDFRPIYRQLEPVRRRFATAVCLAMTATAAPRVRADIKQSLGIGDAGEFLASFDRPNLFLAAQLRTGGHRQLVSFLREHRDEPGIIYCTTKRMVESVAQRLQGSGYRALPYHAGLDDKTRRDNQRAFVRDEAQIIVATVAFGMGINKSNVRFVVHYNMPSSLEAYYQEIGRSGRDGLRADCLLLYHMQDVQTHAQMIDEGAEEERAGRNARLQAMLRFAQAHTCRRPLLLRYFGEEPAEEGCGFCDNCRAEASEQPREDVTEAAQKLLACVMRTGEMFGVSHIVDVLRGSKSSKVLDRRHDLLPMYGAGREHSARHWRTLAQQWIQQELLEQDMEHGGLRLTEQGHEVLRGERRAYAEPEVQPGLADAPAQRGTAVASVPSFDEGLFEHLRTLRRQLAAAANLPPYMVFSDRALAEMAAYLPETPVDFADINGVGRAKLESYGDTFLAAIAAYCAEHEVPRQPRVRTMPAVTPPRPSGGGKRSQEIGSLFAGGASLAALQEMYGVKQSTIVSHLRDYVLEGGSAATERLRAECALPPQKQEKVKMLLGQLGGERLGPIYEALEGTVGYEDLHLLRLVWLVERQRG